MIFAHRGFSSRQPEMTRAAYRAAIEWAAAQNVELWLECDVHFSADDQLICLHDLTVDRTSNGSGPAFELTVAELSTLDFGWGRVEHPTPEQSGLVTLEELMTGVADARAAGVGVGLAIETKHPNPRGLDVEDRVAALVRAYGWDRPGAPVRLISFSEPAIVALGRLLPALPRTFLIEVELGRFADGHLPDGVRVAGPDLALLKQDPDFVARACAHGNEIHVWTVNEPADIAFCLDLGVTGFTTDYPDRVLDALRTGSPSSPGMPSAHRTTGHR